jgi:hypothetical protein
LRQHDARVGAVPDEDLRQEPEEVVPKLAPYLKAVHIGNALMKDRLHPAYGDLQPRFDLPGTEITVDHVRRFLRTLLDNLRVG